VKFSRGFLIVIGRSPVATAPTYSMCFPFCLSRCVYRYISPSAEPARLRSEMPHDACIYNTVAGLSGFFFSWFTRSHPHLISRPVVIKERLHTECERERERRHGTWNSYILLYYTLLCVHII